MVKTITSTSSYSYTMATGTNLYLVIARSWAAVHTGAMVWLTGLITSDYGMAIPLTDTNSYAPTISISGRVITIKSGVESQLLCSIYKVL